MRFVLVRYVLSNTPHVLSYERKSCQKYNGAIYVSREYEYEIEEDCSEDIAGRDIHWNLRMVISRMARNAIYLY
jgi:hypothetical protein